MERCGAVSLEAGSPNNNLWLRISFSSSLSRSSVTTPCLALTSERSTARHPRAPLPEMADDYEEAVTRCMCGNNGLQDIFMIECDGCKVWQVRFTPPFKFSVAVSRCLLAASRTPSSIQTRQSNSSSCFSIWHCFPFLVVRSSASFASTASAWASPKRPCPSSTFASCAIGGPTSIPATARAHSTRKA